MPIFFLIALLFLFSVIDAIESCQTSNSLGLSIKSGYSSFSFSVLFPSYQGVIDLNAQLLNDALSYDVNNPNMITKLVPKHYLLESQLYEGFETEDGNIRDPYDYYGSEAVPGAGMMGQPQIIAGLLFTWARYFDEIKMFLDQASNLLHVDYDSSDVVADQFLPFLANPPAPCHHRPHTHSMCSHFRIHFQIHLCIHL